MDHLHRAGIEILSPNFMNQRQVDKIKFIPPVIRKSAVVKEEKLPEELVFDKAIEANKVEDKIESLGKIDIQLKGLEFKLKETKDKNKLNDRIKRLNDLKKKLTENLEKEKNKLNKHK